jgi:phosphoribosylformylglycinamidine synthase
VGKLTPQELRYLEEKLARKANSVEKDIISAEWSEHCSYKSSKKHIKRFPSQGARVIAGPGYDAGVIDIGGGQVLTVHIESHNHPSAVEPYGGAATGVGGVLRDIISMGTRPIALLDALRFSPVQAKQAVAQKSKWLFKNVVKGIADYGNCVGIPTVAGEVEFDQCFEDYCLVDVASIGYGNKEDIVLNSADVGDLLVLVGGSTGRDGLHGASFASRSLKGEDRSAVQIPDPFLEKLLLEATMEAVSSKCIKAMKDLGGGGLSCCLSETSDAIGRGFEVELSKVKTREDRMNASEIMISESQERMLFITDRQKFDKLKRILEKFELPFAIIGSVHDHRNLTVLLDNHVVANMPSKLIAHAPLIDRSESVPSYISKLGVISKPRQPKDLGKVLLSLLSDPTIASKKWIYEQYDHEVGIRTVTKPGHSDAAVLKLDNGKFIAAKLDGNSKQTFLDPYRGTQGCLSEGYRNIVCSGAEPIAVIDHLQFASPEEPEVYWTFHQAVNAIVDYCTAMSLPVVGGKVSFYNQTRKGPIKPSPVIGTFGLIENEAWIVPQTISDGSSIFVVGKTMDEMGGSEYYESFHSLTGGKVPLVDIKTEKMCASAVKRLVRNGMVESVHDCSKGGIAVALAEMAIMGRLGIRIDTDAIPSDKLGLDDLLFSETNSRYLLATTNAAHVRKMLNESGAPFGEIGIAGGSELEFVAFKKPVVKLGLNELYSAYNSLNMLMR